MCAHGMRNINLSLHGDQLEEIFTGSITLPALAWVNLKKDFFKQPHKWLPEEFWTPDVHDVETTKFDKVATTHDEKVLGINRVLLLCPFKITVWRTP